MGKAFSKHIVSQKEYNSSSIKSEKRSYNKPLNYNKFFFKKSSSSQMATTVQEEKVATPVTSSGEASYKFKDGRRYHGQDDVAYVLPNDDDETDRLHQQHWILKYILKRNFRAPVNKLLEEGITVLDSGTGAATWALEMAEAYPKSKFYGVDISSTFPKSIKPHNVEFLIGNIAKELPFPDNTFDYVHQRLLLAGLTDDNWTATLKEIFRVLKPGGFIELGELNIFEVANMGPSQKKSQDAGLAIFKMLNIPLGICSELKDRLAQAGFTDQSLEVTPIPLNHGGKGGELFWEDMLNASRTMQLALAKIHPEWEDADVYEQHLAISGKENRENKCCFDWYSFYAQKPRKQ